MQAHPRSARAVPGHRAPRLPCAPTALLLQRAIAALLCSNPRWADEAAPGIAPSAAEMQSLPDDDTVRSPGAEAKGRQAPHLSPHDRRSRVATSRPGQHGSRWNPHSPRCDRRSPPPWTT